MVTQYTQYGYNVPVCLDAAESKDENEFLAFLNYSIKFLAILYWVRDNVVKWFSCLINHCRLQVMKHTHFTIKIIQKLTDFPIKIARKIDHV